MTTEALDVWKTLAPGIIERGQLTCDNASIFADVCEQLALYRRVQREVAQLPALSYSGPNGAMCQHPHLKTLRELQFGLKVPLRQWGLTPHDMAMLKTQEAVAGTVPRDLEDEEFSNL